MKETWICEVCSECPCVLESYCKPHVCASGWKQRSCEFPKGVDLSEWREVPAPCTETASDDGPEFPIKESMKMGYTWTGTPPDGSIISITQVECPDCKDKDAEIERLRKRVLVREKENERLQHKVMDFEEFDCLYCADKDAEIAQIKRNARIAFENVKGEYVDGWVTWADDGTVKLYNNMDDKIERLRKERNDAQAEIERLKEEVSELSVGMLGLQRERIGLEKKITGAEKEISYQLAMIDALKKERIMGECPAGKLDEILARLDEWEAVAK